MKRSVRLFATLILMLGLVVVFYEPAQADTVPFVLLIEKGLEATFFGTDSDGLSIYESVQNANIHPIVNGKVDYSSKWGTAVVIVWGRSVTDPFFAPLGPLAALVKLYFDPPLNLQVHLGLIQTPSGFQTTIGVVGNQSVRGNWAIADGTLVGGTATDLVIGGLLVIGTPSPPFQANLDLTLYQYFPSFPYSFHSDLFPTCEHSVPAAGYPFGSFYGFTTVFGQARPVSSYTLDAGGLGIGHLMALHTGGDGYFVVACGKASHPGTAACGSGSGLTFADCTLSGTGPLAPYTGDAVYLPGNHVGEAILSLFNWYLVLQ